MKVTYLNHSGFLLEWEDCCWIFDYYKGDIPPLDSKKMIFVFCSHSHGDHFNPAVFGLAQKYPGVQYVFSNEVRRAVRKLERMTGKCGTKGDETEASGITGDGIKDSGIEDDGIKDSGTEDSRTEDSGTRESDAVIPVPEITFLTVRADAQIPDGASDTIQVHTLQSTDCGCAFVLRYKGKTIYHAGDLHWWTWPGEPEADNRKMEADYKKEMEYLEGMDIDLAFTPLDPRQEEDYAKGMNYFLQKTHTAHIFPMHFWNDFTVMGKFPEEYPAPEHTQFHMISRDGQSWEIE